jgi:ELWxxDGT repeat protein
MSAPVRVYWFLAALLLGPGAALGGAAGCLEARISSNFLKSVNGVLFFAVSDPHGGGWQLWRTDGSGPGTALVKDGLGLDIELEDVGDTLFFGVRDGLWKSDGTSAGTVLVKALPFFPARLTRVRRLLYFSQGNGQLWRSDGTEAGTVMVRDIPPGFVRHDLTPNGLADLNGTVIFRATDRSFGSELWKSDGTSEGTVLVKDINSNFNPNGWSEFSNPGDFTALGGHLLFSADDGTGYELWRTDGTSEGTVRVKDINPGGDSHPINLRAVNGTVFFTADDGSGPELWRTDGTEAGTTRVADINPTGGSFPSALLNVNGTLFFRADDGTHGAELWRTDGTAAGTWLVADIDPDGGAHPANLRILNGSIVFSADDGVHGEELWRSDGTSGGTELVTDLNAVGGSYPSGLARVGGTLLFSADDGAGGQLWLLGGCAPAGACTVTPLVLPAAACVPQGPEPFMVRDISPGPSSSKPYGLTVAGGVLFFRAFEETSGIELWKSDGSEAGTVRVLDINPGPADSRPYELTDVGGTLFFTAVDPERGRSLWKSDGTPGGTTPVPLSDVLPGYGTYPRELTAVGATLYFRAEGNDSGLELWKSDGTAAGTGQVHDILPGPASSAPEELTAVGPTLFFTAITDTDGIFYRQLWKSDGTAAGTVLVKDGFLPSTETMLLTNVAGTLFFRAITRHAGLELWKSDGTTEGTTQVRDIHLLRPSSAPEDLTAIGDTLFFTARTAEEGRELWRSDGTWEGTTLVRDIFPGMFDGSPKRLTESGGTLFFHAQDGVNGSELWKSDGTFEGTVLVRDIDPSNVTVPGFFTDVDGTLYFSASNPGFGRELWKSDGTAAGTVLVKNINLNLASYPEELTNVNGTLFFYADDERHGYELWALGPAGGPAPTTTTTSTTLPPREDCGNCLDDDENGLIDVADPACCTAPPARLRMERTRVEPGGSGRLTLRAGLPGLAGLPAAPEDVVLQLEPDGGGDVVCARLPAARFRSKRRAFLFRGGQGPGGAWRIALLKLQAKSGVVEMLARGERLSRGLVTAGGLGVTVALGGPAVLPRCWTGTGSVVRR